MTGDDSSTKITQNVFLCEKDILSKFPNICKDYTRYGQTVNIIQVVKPGDIFIGLPPYEVITLTKYSNYYTFMCAQDLANKIGATLPVKNELQ
jgi:hypothetical protein